MNNITSREFLELTGLNYPIESVSVFPLIGDQLYASVSVRENKIRDDKGVVISTETKHELAFLAGKAMSWPVDHKDQARDYNVKQALQEEIDAPKRVFESPYVTIRREMQEETGGEWPLWEKYVTMRILEVEKGGAHSYMILAFIRFPDASAFAHVNPKAELREFVHLPYHLDGKKLVVTEPEGAPELRKFFKNILFKFYGQEIYQEIKRK